MKRYQAFIIGFALVHGLVAMLVGFEARQADRRARAMNPGAHEGDDTALSRLSRVLVFPVRDVAPMLFVSPIFAFTLNGAVWGILLAGARFAWEHRGRIQRTAD